ALLDHHGEPEREQQAQDRVRPIEAAEQQALDRDTNQADDHRRDDERAGKTDPVGEDDGEVGADGIEAAMRQVDDAAQREDERKAERDQQVVRADQQTVENLLEEKNELHD